MLFFFGFCIQCLFGEDATQEKKEDPWWTGTLLSNPGTVTPVGTINVEPYLFVNNFYGIYDRHWQFQSREHFVSINPQILVSVGILKNVDVQIIVQAFDNHFRGGSSTSIGDTYLELGIQLLEDKKDSWIPALQIVFDQNFPTGNFQNLRSNLFGADVSGTGLYTFGVGLNFEKVLYFKKHPTRFRLNAEYFFPSSSSVSGFNAFGGGFDTKGQIQSDGGFTTIAAVEYGMTKNWVFALDLVHIHNSPITFRGRMGTIAPDRPAAIGLRAFDNISLAPALEYNYNADVGIIWGVWFSVAGKNNLAFLSPAMAINLNF